MGMWEKESLNQLWWWEVIKDNNMKAALMQVLRLERASCLEVNLVDGQQGDGVERKEHCKRIEQ
jgi:hypothetical protein